MHRLVPTVFLNVVLPTCLFFAFILRPSLLSAFYGILLLIWPFVPNVNGSVPGIPDFTKRYLLVSTIVTLTGILIQSIFQIILATTVFSDGRMDDCGELASILRVVGLQRLNIPNAGHVIRLISPDVAACASSIATYVVFLLYARTPPSIAPTTGGRISRSSTEDRNLQQQQRHQSGVYRRASISTTRTSERRELGTQSPVNPDSGILVNNNAAIHKASETNRPYVTRLFIVCMARLSEAVVVVLLCAAGVIHPSILSSIYFLAFLLIMTWWALYKPMSVGAFNFVKLSLAAYSAFHLIVLYLYQTREFQVALPPESLTARLLGLTVLVNTSCEQFWILNIFPGQQWPIFANPVVIFVFYIYVALQTVSTYRAGIRGPYDGWKAVSTFIHSSAAMADDHSSLHDEVFEDSAKPADRRSLLANESDEEGGDTALDNDPDARRNFSAASAPARLENQPSSTNLANGGRSGSGGGNRAAALGRDYKRLFSIGTVPVEQTENRPLGAAVAYVVRNSYALALVMMMAWAITYHSWLAFVWLAMACIIWMMADSRRACFLLSPFIVIYAEVLLCLQFIYGLNLNSIELPDDYVVTGVPMQQIGLMKPTGAPCMPLFIKAFFSIPFWITLRLHLRERYYQKRGTIMGAPSGGTVTSSYVPVESLPPANHLTGAVAHGFLGYLLAKYWIFIVGLVLLLISVRTPVVAYEVCYMAFFVVLITVLQISFTIWRLMLFLYWTILTAFSIGVLLLVYTYQFNEVPTWWHNWTRWPNEAFDDLGLVSYYPGTLFVQLLTPISFLIVVILQMKFFHSSFMRLTDFNHRSEKAEFEQSALVKGSKWFPRFKRSYEIICNLLWRLAEIHFAKLVAFSMIILAVSEVCAVNFIFSIIVCCMLPCRRMHTALSVIATIWTALVMVAKMIYQMNFVDVSNLSSFYQKNCTTFAFIEDPAKWAGFMRLGPKNSVIKYLEGYVAVLVLLTFQAIIKIRQKYCREVLGQPTPARGVLFPGIGRQDADESVMKCLKFLANYGFYKFGLEITFIFVIIDVGVRMDAVAFIYAVWMLIMLAIPRRTLSKVWWLFVTYVAISLPVQYAVCVGLPPSSCLQYPWSGINSKLVYWLYLPSYDVKPNQWFLLGDFFVLLMASAQLYVFRIELAPTTSASFEGGDNAPIWHYQQLMRMNSMGAAESGDQPRPSADDPPHMGDNPTPNFITCTKSYLDVAKIFIFVYFHWITLFVIFAAGVGGISGFAFGYLVAAFALLWKGNDLYLEAHSRVMIRWYILLFYNVFAIMLKISLQVVGCVYICNVCDSSTSWVVQLFSIACLRGREEKCVSATYREKCTVSKGEAEIVYDGVCFAFLIFQLRIFSSWYFRHSISEYRAERILSARGAYLINQLIRKEMHEQKEKEDRILKKVKAKTTRIRKHYLKQMEGKKHFEPNTYAESDCPMLRSFTEAFRSAFIDDDYYAAKRGGDYYMFDYDSDEDEPEELEEHEPTAPETSATPEHHKGLGPAQLLHMAGQKSFDLSEVVSEATKREATIKRELSAGKDFPTSSSSRSIDLNDVRLTMTAISEREDENQEHDQDEPITITASPREEIDGEEEKKEEAGGSYCMYGLEFMRMLAGSVLNSLASTFNRWSRDYRYVAFVLKGEKRRLKETLMKDIEHENDFRRVRETVSNQEVRKTIHYVHTMRDIETAEREAQEITLEHNVVARFLIATYYLLVSHTELLCYLMIVLDHMGNAAIISLPLPFLAFFWGTLCSPRPPKFFWVTVITYTEAMIVVKFMFQFGFWQFDKSHDYNPFYGPKILGIEQNNYYAGYDVALLMILFFHRYVLKTLGLWKDAQNEADLNEIDAEMMDGIEPKPVNEEEEEEEASEEVVQETNAALAAMDVIEDDTCDDGEIERHTFPSGVRRFSAAMQGRLAYCSSFTSFYRRLLNPPFRYVMDLYSFMFLCDVICFLILAFGYSSFGEVVRGRKYDVVSEIQQNKVPLPFVTMLITLMFLIIVDRAIYLSKNLIGKLIFQYFLVTAIHTWIFFGLPAMTDWPISKNGPAQFWYFVKCVYFLLSAWQIRNSYPSRIQGNLLAKKFGLTNYCLFTGFMAIPFLFELRTLIDWIWTETSMPLFDYFTMENMYACIFRSKCMREYEMEYPVPRNLPKPKWIKYGLGLPVLILIVVLLWLPLLLFALVNAIGNRVPPEQAQFSVAIEGYPPLYVMEAQKIYLNRITDPQYDALYDLCGKNKQGIAFLKQYWESDVYVARFRGGSMSEWAISPFARQALLNDLKNFTSDIVINFNWQFRRPSQSVKQLPQMHTSTTFVDLKKNTDEDQRIRQELIDTLEGRNHNGITISSAFSPFLIVPSLGLVQAAKAVLYTDTNTTTDDMRETYAGVKLFMDIMTPEFPKNASVVQFWKMQMIPPAWMSASSYTKASDGDVEVTVFIDRVFPTYLDTFTSGGIIGLYVVVVWAAGRFIRTLVVCSPLEVILYEMPNVNRVLQLCLDIFLVREAGDFLLEQDLFAKLIFLFRSPETLIRWTRPKIE